MSYADFLKKKAETVQPAGRDVARDSLPPLMHEWQKDLVIWACQVGRAALWADTGLGKTIMQCEWARQMGERSLIKVDDSLARPLWKFAYRREPISPMLRERIYSRDGFACIECRSRTDLTLDHIYPWSLGGPDSEDNLQTLCRPCNSRKGATV